MGSPQRPYKTSLEHVPADTQVERKALLELCTPHVLEFDRTVAFYESNGFEITGGYKMKRTIG